MAKYYLVSTNLDQDAISYLEKLMDSVANSSECRLNNVVSWDEESINYVKEDIAESKPKVVISLGVDSSRVLSDKFKFLASSRGKLLPYENNGYSTKMVVSYLKQRLVTLTNIMNM